ncbi:MAG: transposase [Rhodovibrio sp.]|nr:transposase [Rhodovibrio sp.]
MEAVFWIVRTGAQWRDLPSEYGNWNSVHKRFRRWVRKGVFEHLFEILSHEPDFEYAMIDANDLSGRISMQPAQRGSENQAHRAIPRRINNEIVALVDALGNSAIFILLPGQRHDSVGTIRFVNDTNFDALLGIKPSTATHYENISTIVASKP